MLKRKTSEGQTFYRNFFGGLCLLFLGAGFIFPSPYAFWLSLFCGIFSRTAERKGWADPAYAEHFRRPIRSLLGKPLEKRCKVD
ncbi:MAG: hypothetical protein ACLFN0_09145 [Thermovirgaceae bacterium]